MCILSAVKLEILMGFCFRDLSSNYFETFHKDTFRGLKHLSVLDLSLNALDYLPLQLFNDLENLSKL